MVRKDPADVLKPVFVAAAEVQVHLARFGERFCFIGGVALQRWGEPRFTRDVDLTVLCPLGSEPELIDRVLSVFEERISGAREFALRNRVVLVKTAAGIPVDVALGALAYEERCIERSVEFDFGDEAPLRICSAEDLVILKTFAGRGQDWVDLDRVLIRQRRSLNWPLIESELKPLLELREAPENLERLLELRHRIDRTA